MERSSIENIAAVIAYVEAHLNEKLDLETVANAVHYSKYHLHRMFTDTAGMTLHEYIRRRRLTEAAKLLVFSQKSLLEIALAAGYESQQAFTGIFKDMYKRTPLEYRENQTFYPLQLAFTLNSRTAAMDITASDIVYATKADLPDWMDFVRLVIDGFPGFEEAEHVEHLKYYIAQKQALLIRDKQVVAGAAAFSRQAGSIDFLGVHPQYRKYKIAEALLDFILCNVFTDRKISITTFREGDKADTGQREAYKKLGFAEAELLTEFGYPTQRLVLFPRSNEPSSRAKCPLGMHGYLATAGTGGMFR